MLDVDIIKTMLLEETYPTLTDEQLKMLALNYDNINEACYYGCLMKARVDKVKIGPIEVESNSDYWLKLADGFYRKFIRESQEDYSITGHCMRRADEL
jgi:hypothetical protein|uniref:hypothetical protein n=1 Tax=Candidatus Stercorousia sp. TaxID=3048886 RepID=UPI00204BD470|nr:MAG TPA: hypothetical protein [Caudoviricetes sp.]DAM98043.1 MAG TPA: hypothetical protein [Caudoviricetes sp.]